MSKKSPINIRLLSAITLINGMIIMIFEIVGARMMSPYFGGSIIVWTSLIGMIMLSLSLGYWVGGRRADRYPNLSPLGLILLISSIATFFAVFFYDNLFIFIQTQQYHPVIGSLLAAGLIFFLPNLFMGMVLPYATKLATVNFHTLGKSVGNLYAWATVGSIFGTFLAGFVLIPNFHISDIVLVLAVILLMLSVVTFHHSRSRLVIMTFLMLAVLFSTQQMYPVFAYSIYQVNSAYNFIYVQDFTVNGTHRRNLMANDNIESNICLNCPERLDNVYAEYRHIFSIQPDITRVLIIGGGGYTIASDILARYAVTVDVVEIDPVMTEVSRQFFGLKNDPRLTIYHQDGRQFLQQNENKYDLIILDAFLDSSSVPQHLTTVEFVDLLKSHLREDGFVFLNLVSALAGPNSHFFQTEYNTYREIFPQVVVYSQGSEEQIANILFFAAKNENFNPANLIGLFSPGEIKEPVITRNDYLTDDWAPVEYFNLNF